MSQSEPPEKPSEDEDELDRAENRARRRRDVWLVDAAFIGLFVLLTAGLVVGGLLLWRHYRP